MTADKPQRSISIKVNRKINITVLMGTKNMKSLKELVNKNMKTIKELVNKNMKTIKELETKKYENYKREVFLQYYFLIEHYRALNACSTCSKLCTQ